MAKEGKAEKKEKKNQSFEASMERLEDLVEKMESSDLPLDEIIHYYEEGMQLIKGCGEQLNAAEKKIKLLTRDKGGEIRENDLKSGVETEKKSGSVEDSEEASLF